MFLIDIVKCFVNGLKFKYLIIFVLLFECYNYKILLVIYVCYLCCKFYIN